MSFWRLFTKKSKKETVPPAPTAMYPQCDGCDKTYKTIVPNHIAALDYKHGRSFTAKCPDCGNNNLVTIRYIMP